MTSASHPYYRLLVDAQEGGGLLRGQEWLRTCQIGGLMGFHTAEILRAPAPPSARLRESNELKRYCPRSCTTLTLHARRSESHARGCPFDQPLRTPGSTSEAALNDEWVPLQMAPELNAALEDYAAYEGQRLGWCLLCNMPILTEADFISEPHTHGCPKGRRQYEMGR